MPHSLGPRSRAFRNQRERGKPATDRLINLGSTYTCRNGHISLCSTLNGVPPPAVQDEKGHNFNNFGRSAEPVRTWI